MDKMKPGVYSEKRIFPTHKPPQPCSKILSVLDATTARFAPTGAIWLYDLTPGHDAREPDSFAWLERSLKSVLTYFQHWAGRLRWATASDVPEEQRYAGRIVIDYGRSDDPGVDVALAYSERRLEDIAPSQAARLQDRKIWDATSFPQTELVNPQKLALSDLQDGEILPAVTIQLTAFSCGGYGIAVHIAHPLADAHALSVFMQHWAAHNQGMRGNKDNLNKLRRPVFDPDLIDRHALPISSGAALEEKSNLARSLPIHRYDWWGIEDKGYPEWAVASTKTNMALLPANSLPLSPAVPAPWSSWNASAPLKHVFFRIPAAMSMRLRSIGRSGRLASHSVGRLDAVLAHMWILINDARFPDGGSTGGINEQDTMVHLILTLGSRTRVRPPLPYASIGSPIFLIRASTSVSALKAPTTKTTKKLPLAGRLICDARDAMSLEAINAMLHDAAHEEIPQRLWSAFLGTRHILSTNWTHLELYKIDFWGGEQTRPPRLVQAVAPQCDGLLEVMDTDVNGDMDVGLCLEAGAMERLLGAGNVFEY